MLNQTDQSAANRTGIDDWFTPGKFAALFGLLLFFTFFDVFIGRSTFFYRDFGVFTYPIAQHYRDAFWHGEMPLWDNLNCSGIPLLAQWNTAMLYPPSLFYLLFPLQWSLGVFSLAHLFLAGMGMYFLARRWTGSQLAAAVAGLAFGYSGLTWYMVMWISNLAAYAWMPWVMLAVELAWRQGGRRVILASLAGAAQMLAGAPEIILLTWCVLGLLWAMEFFRAEIPRAKLIWRFAIIPAIVAALSLAQLLPFLELLRHSDRDASFDGTGWAMPLTGPANFLVPPFHCQTTGHGIYVQIDQYWISSHYAGIGIVALALAGALSVRNRRVWLLTGAAAFGLLMALGVHGGIYSAIKAVFPQIGFMRYPIKFVTLTMFALPLLAAFAVSRQTAPSDSPRAQKLLPGIALCLLVLISLIVWLAWKHQLPSDDWPATWQNALKRALFLIAIVAAIIGVCRVKEFKLQWLLSVAFLYLLWTDVQTHAPNLSPTVDPSVFAPGLVRAELKLNPTAVAGEPRFMGTAAALNKIRFTNLSKPESDYLCRRLALYDDCNLLDSIPKVDGFVSIYLRETADVIGLLYACDARNIDLPGLKDFLGIGFINVADPTGEKALDWINRTTALPLITAGQKPVFADATNTMAALANPAFDPRQVVYLPPEAKASVSADKAEAKIISQPIAAHKISFTVDAQAPALVVLAQSFYKPWRAYVDGQRTTVLRANHAFQAVAVPAGKHEVILKYEDSSFRAGAIISLFTLAGCVVVLLRRGKTLPA